MTASQNNSVWFGASLNPSAKDVQSTLSIAQWVDGAGLDFISLMDHPYNPEFLDTWTLLSVIGARTQHIRLLTDVANLPLRPPAILAKSAATLDILTGGRTELGLGAGYAWEGIVSYGGPQRSPGKAVAALEEAIQVIRSLWEPAQSEKGVSFNGQFYQLANAQPGPFPPHPIGIWLGAYKPKMLDLVGRLADGWIPSAGIAPPEEILRMQAIIDRAAQQAGRDPAAIHRAYNIAGVIQSEDGRSMRPARPGVIIGSPEHWVDRLSHYIQDLRIDAFSFYPLGEDPRDQIQRFAMDVVPTVRQALA